MKAYKEFLKKGYILTSKTCPKCKRILLRDPKTNLEFCPECGYKESEKEILEKLKWKVLKLLENEKDLDNMYKGVKTVYFLEKILKSFR